jgi:hypothetical protein
LHEQGEDARYVEKLRKKKTLECEELDQLEQRPLVKSQRFTLIRVEKFLRVQCTNPVGLVEMRVSWPGHPRLSKKKKISLN